MVRPSELPPPSPAPPPRASPASAVVRGLAPLGAAIAVGLALQLAVSTGTYAEKILFDIGVNIILAVSLNLVNGFTGQFSIGHAGFMAIGAYTSAMFTLTIGVKIVAGPSSLPPPGAPGIAPPFPLGAGGLPAAGARWAGGAASLRP